MAARTRPRDKQPAVGGRDILGHFEQGAQSDGHTRDPSAPGAVAVDVSWICAMAHKGLPVIQHQDRPAIAAANPRFGGFRATSRDGGIRHRAP